MGFHVARMPTASNAASAHSMAHTTQLLIVMPEPAGGEYPEWLP
jgi:hypothetical protein